MTARILLGLFLIAAGWVMGVFVLGFILFATGVVGACHGSPDSDWIVPLVFFTWIGIGIVVAVAFVARCIKKDTIRFEDKTRDRIAEMRAEARAEREKNPG